MISSQRPTRRTHRQGSAWRTPRQRSKINHTLQSRKAKLQKLHSKQTSDFFNNYTFVTYSNDRKSRELVGIHHPAMQHVSVNDYMNAFDNVTSNLRNEVYKSKIEKKNDLQEYKYILNNIANSHKQKIQQKQSRRRHSIGGAAGAAGDAAHDAAVVDAPEPEQDEPFNFLDEVQPDITLQERLTFEKLQTFIMLSSRASSLDGWNHRAKTFLKYMFLDTSEFECMIVGGKLTGNLIDNQQQANYEFEIETSTYLTEPNANDHRYLTQAPPLNFKLGAVPDSISWITLKEVAPTIHTGIHTSISTLTVDVSMFQGNFNKMSNIQRRHYVYCIILFVIMNASESELRNFIDDFNRVRDDRSKHLHLDAVIEITTKIKQHLRLGGRDINNVLPYCMFFNRATLRGQTVTPGDINMIFLNTILEMEDAAVYVPGNYRNSDRDRHEFSIPEKYSSRYFELLHHIYKKIFLSTNTPVFQFDINIPQLQLPVQQMKINLNTVRFQHQQDFVFYFTLNNTDNIAYIPDPEDTRVGIIEDYNQNAFFYRDINSQTVGFIPRNEHSVVERDIMKQVPLSLSREVWTVESRITEHRDKLMGYLSHLVYFPNDVIVRVSEQFFNRQNGRNSFTYVGPFDRDPSYPPSTEGIIIYSRVHVWLKTSSFGGELYFVIRGSKTGYDWDSADSDIQNGLLNSQRSLKTVNILREVIEYLDICLSRGAGSPQLQEILLKLKGKPIQIYSSGHSLGGYLSLSVTHNAFCMNAINGFSFDNISGINGIKRKRRQQIVLLNSYVIPIVFDPYVASPSIMNAFSFLPYARIHSCIDSDVSIDPPSEEGFFTIHALITLLQTSQIRYDDAASGYFLAYLRKKHSMQSYYNTMGNFSIFHYKNVYNVFENFIYHDTYYKGGPVKRITYDMRKAHNLLHFIGIVPEYIFAYMFQTNLSINTRRGPQSVQAAHYNFPIPNNKLIIPSIVPYSGPTSFGFQSNCINVETLEANELGSSCVSMIIYQQPNYTVERIVPQSNQAFTNECVRIFVREITDFINSPF